MDKQETKQKVFMTAAELFAAKGYYQVSVREICEAAGVTKPVLYYYFKDKEDLLEELVREVHLRFNEILTSYINKDAPFQDNLEGLYNAYLKFAQENHYLIRLSAIIQFSSVPKKIKIAHDQVTRQMQKPVYAIFKKGKKEGIIPEDADPEMILLSLFGPFGVMVMESIFLDENNPRLYKKLKAYFSFWKQQFLNKESKTE